MEPAVRQHPISATRLTELGNRLAADLYDRPFSLEDLILITLEEVFLVAIDSDESLSPEAAVTLVASRLADAVASGDYAAATVTKAISIQARMAKFLSRGRRIEDVNDVTAHDIRAWINARAMSDKAEPSARTKDNRRWAADMFFRELRGLGLYVGDPLTDLTIDGRVRNAARALTDAEMELCRRFSARNRQDTRGPAAWALTEAGATTSELPNVTAADVDFDQQRVWLCGSRLQPRWGLLSDWGAQQVRRRIEIIDDAETSLIYQGNGSPESQQASACDAIHETLGRAGVRQDKSVRPSSVRAWLAHTLYAETSDLFLVAHRLGFRRLENARELLGLAMHDADIAPSHRRGDA
jgi:site-specific recombinase XerD